MQLTFKKIESSMHFGRLEIQPELTLWLTGYSLELLSLFLLSHSLLLTSLLGHSVASIILACSLSQLMPRQSRSNWIVFFLFVFCLLIPLVSGVGLLLSLEAGLNRPKIKYEKLFVRVESSQPPIDSIQSESFIHLSTGRIKAILQYSPQQAERLKAILATQRMTDETAIPLLNIALLDTVDEVRLLAYSMLDSKRKKLDYIIHKGLTKLKSLSLDAENKKLIYQSLAESFWEMTYLRLVEGQSRQHALNSAKQYVMEAQTFQNNDASLHLLHARICISLRLYKEAQNSLKLAKNYGMSAVKLAPLSAEIAFEKKQFNKIAKQLKPIDQLAQKNEILGGLVEQWN